MDAATAILTFLTALPDLIKLGVEIMNFLNKASGNDPAGYIKKVGAAMTALNAAETQEERNNAASLISKAIAGLP